MTAKAEAVKPEQDTMTTAKPKPSANGKPSAKESAVDALLDRVFPATGPRAFRKGEKAVEYLQHVVDAQASEQTRAIAHHPAVLKLEGSVRGLARLIEKARPNKKVKIRVWPMSFSEMAQDLDHAAGLDHSQLFRTLYEEGIGAYHGMPVGALVADYEFDASPEKLDVLRKLSAIGKAGKFPVLANPAPGLVNLDSWTDLASPRSIRRLARVEELEEFADLRAYRNEEDSLHVVLPLPRVLARLLYGSGKTCRAVKEFPYEEADLNEDGSPRPLPHDKYCWMGAAWVAAERLAEAARQFGGMCVAIFGPRAGGTVPNLPISIGVDADSGESITQCPTEVPISFRKEEILSGLGLLPLVHKKSEAEAAFLSSQTLHRPKDSLDAETAANEELAATLAYQMARFRVLHHLVLYSQRLIGKPITLQSMQAELNLWLKQFILDDQPSEELCHRFPLASAHAVLKEHAKKPGCYMIHLVLAPWIKLKKVIVGGKLSSAVPKTGGQG
jgi:type VI secretion system protein ImpC